MTERVRARETSTGKERCPYCHEEFGAAARVSCAGCGTPHHGDCFEENGGCSALGCERAVAVESTEAPRDLLMLRVAVFGALSAIVGGLFLAAGAVAFGSVLALAGLVALVPALGMRLLGGAAEALPLPPPGPREEPAPFVRTEVPVDGVRGAQILIATPNRRSMEPLPEPSGADTTCPSCSKPLEAGSELAHCYHCGASLQ